MTRNQRIEQLIIAAMEEFSTYDTEQMDCAYQNLLEDFYARCSDQELEEAAE